MQVAQRHARAADAELARPRRSGRAAPRSSSTRSVVLAIGLPMRDAVLAATATRQQRRPDRGLGRAVHVPQLAAARASSCVARSSGSASPPTSAAECRAALPAGVDQHAPGRRRGLHDGGRAASRASARSARPSLTSSRLASTTVAPTVSGSSSSSTAMSKRQRGHREQPVARRRPGSRRHAGEEVDHRAVRHAPRPWAGRWSRRCRSRRPDPRGGRRARRRPAELRRGARSIAASVDVQQHRRSGAASRWLDGRRARSPAAPGARRWPCTAGARPGRPDPAARRPRRLAGWRAARPASPVTASRHRPTSAPRPMPRERSQSREPVGAAVELGVVEQSLRWSSAVALRRALHLRGDQVDHGDSGGRPWCGSGSRPAMACARPAIASRVWPTRASGDLQRRRQHARRSARPADARVASVKMSVLKVETAGETVLDARGTTGPGLPRHRAGTAGPAPGADRPTGAGAGERPGRRRTPGRSASGSRRAPRSSSRTRCSKGTSGKAKASSTRCAHGFTSSRKLHCGSTRQAQRQAR